MIALILGGTAIWLLSAGFDDATVRILFCFAASAIWGYVCAAIDNARDRRAQAVKKDKP